VSLGGEGDWGLSSDYAVDGSVLKGMDEFILADDTIPESLLLFIDNQQVYRPNFYLNVKDATESTQRHIAKLEQMASNYLIKVLNNFVTRNQIDSTWIKTVFSVVLKAIRSIRVKMIYAGDENCIESCIEIKCLQNGHQCESDFFSGIVLESKENEFVVPTDIHDSRILLVDFPLNFCSKSEESIENIQSNSSDDSDVFQKQVEEDLLNRILAIRPDFIISTSDISAYTQMLFKNQSISYLMNRDPSDLQKIGRICDTKILQTVDLKYMTGLESFIGICSFLKILDSDTIIRFALQNDKLRSFGTIVLKGESEKSIEIITRATLYIAYNLSLEMAFLVQQFCTFSDEYCKGLGGIKTIGETKKKLRRYLSTGSLESLDREFIANFSPFADSVDWQESLRVSLDKVSLDYVNEESTRLFEAYEKPEMDSASTMRHLYPRTFKVCEIAINKSGVVIGAPNPDPIQVQLYSNIDVSLGKFLLQRCFSKTTPFNQAACFQHGAGQIMIEVLKLPVSFGDANDAIYMWSSCRHDDCMHRSTPVVEISQRTFNFSLSRFLEMMFSNRNGVSRIISCQHNVLHNQIMFFGQRDLVACFIHTRIPRYNLILQTKVKYDSRFNEVFTRLSATNLRAAASTLLTVFADYVGSKRNQFELCSNFKDILELERLVKMHIKEFDEIVLTKLESKESQLSICSLAKDLKRWKEAFKLLDKSLSPKPYKCKCLNEEKKINEDLHPRRKQQRIQCTRHRSRSVNSGNGLHYAILHNSQYLFFSCRKQDKTVDEAVDVVFQPQSSLSFYGFIKAFSLPSDAQDLILKGTENVELPEASESRFPVLNGHFNIPQSIGGVYVPLYPEQPSSWIANSLCSFSYLSYTHNAPIAELKRLKISTKEALNRFQIFQESHEFVEPDDLLKALTSTDVSSFDYVCDDLGEAKTTRFYVRHFFARQFFALRYKLCGGQFNFAQSLANCMDWKASGGKSRASFLKTLDDRIVLKSISEREFTMFLEVLLSYFTYFSDSFALNKPSCLIPILGMFEVASRDSVGNSTQTQFIVVMPNLFYARKMTHIFDLSPSNPNHLLEPNSLMIVPIQMHISNLPLSIQQICIYQMH
jgi:hypothetical protein